MQVLLFPFFLSCEVKKCSFIYSLPPLFLSQVFTLLSLLCLCLCVKDWIFLCGVCVTDENYAYFDEGKGKEDEIKKKKGSPPCIELSLGYGSSSHVVEEDGKDDKSSNSVFTEAQIQELQLQAVIFKYLVSGLPVPFHLFFIIWNSVSSSLGDGGIYKLYPTCKLPILSL